MDLDVSKMKVDKGGMNHKSKKSRAVICPLRAFRHALKIMTSNQSTAINWRQSEKLWSSIYSNRGHLPYILLFNFGQNRVFIFIVVIFISVMTSVLAGWHLLKIPGDSKILKNINQTVNTKSKNSGKSSNYSFQIL